MLRMIKDLFTQGSNRKDFGKGHWKLLNCENLEPGNASVTRRWRLGEYTGKVPQKLVFFIFCSVIHFLETPGDRKLN